MQGVDHRCYGSTDAQLLGKRKRSTPTTAMPEELMAPKEALLQAVHHQVAAINWLYVSGDWPIKKAKQAATYQLNHIKPVQQVQQAAAQHHFLFDCPAYAHIWYSHATLFHGIQTVSSVINSNNACLLNRYLRQCFEHRQSVLG